MFNEVRIHLGLTGRRPKLRPKTLEVVVGRGAHKMPLQVDPSDHPMYLAMPIMSRPIAMSGLSPSDEPSDVTMHVMMHVSQLERHSRLPADTGVRLSLYPPIFPRFLAKIAHAFAFFDFSAHIHEFDLLLPQVILGKGGDVPFLIGTAPPEISDEWRKEQTDDLHSLQIATFGTDKVVWLLCYIQLFANLGSPVYEIVVGRLDRRSDVLELSKLQAQCS